MFQFVQRIASSKTETETSCDRRSNTLNDNFTFLHVNTTYWKSYNNNTIKVMTIVITSVKPLKINISYSFHLIVCI